MDRSFSVLDEGRQVAINEYTDSISIDRSQCDCIYVEML